MSRSYSYTTKTNASYQRTTAGRQSDANQGLHHDELNGQTGQGVQATQPRAVQHGPGYTVFTPDEKQRQNIAQMAQKEQAQYEHYKASHANQNYSHVGAVGGGTLREHEVRRKQASDLKHQQVMKRMKQEELRANRKKAEEEEIERKKAEARKKAEMNAAREGKPPTAEELRRNREAFLRKLQNQ